MRLLPAAVLVLAFLAGCATRRILKVGTIPPGATVRLDGETLGETPLEVPFEHYGVRRITIYKEGYQTHSAQIELHAPWYSHFPIDLVSEVLLPFGWKDKRSYHIELVVGVEGEEVMTAPSLHSVLQRADTLRHAGPEGPGYLPDPEPILLRRGRGAEVEQAKEDARDEEEP